jgi:tetratricopeptide (TPR) repeat protein
MNWGEALADAQRFDEAEAALRQNLAEREAFYGREHPNYAAGLEALGAVLLETGRAAEAVPMFNEAARLYWPEQDPRLAGAAAYRALAMRAAGSPDPPYAGLDSLPAPVIEEMAAELLDALSSVPLPVQRAALADLFPLLTARLPEDDAAMVNTLSAIANVEQALGTEGRPSVRIESIKRVGAIYEKQGRWHESVEALLGLALAHDDAGEREAADAVYREADSRARKLGDPELHSLVLRNFGVHLMEGGQADLADTALTEAVAAGRASGEAEPLGRALVARAALLRQTDRPADALPLLDEAVAILGPSHPDARAAHILRTAIESGAKGGQVRRPRA